MGKNILNCKVASLGGNAGSNLVSHGISILRGGTEQYHGMICGWRMLNAATTRVSYFVCSAVGFLYSYLGFIGCNGIVLGTSNSFVGEHGCSHHWGVQFGCSHHGL